MAVKDALGGGIFPIHHAFSMGRGGALEKCTFWVWLLELVALNQLVGQSHNGAQSRPHAAHWDP